MHIGLVDVDGTKFPNLVLMKLSAWHKREGDSTYFLRPADALLGGNDEMENYRPACRQCNFYKSTMSTEGLHEQLSLIPGRLEKLLTFRLALAYGLIQLTGRSVKFYFEEHGG